MQLAAGIYTGDSSTDPWLGVAGSDPCAVKAGPAEATGVHPRLTKLKLGF